MTTHAQSVREEIIELETSYWNAVKIKDGRRIAELAGEPALVTGPHGAMKISKDKMAKMTEEGEWTLESYAFDNIEVLSPLPDVAIIAYTVEQKVIMKGKPLASRVAHSSTWIRGAAGWGCHSHSETELADEEKAA